MTVGKSLQVWSIVLAAGDGPRRAGRPRAEVERPLQFRAFGRSRSLLRDALERSAGHAPPERTLVVVSEDHARWWSAELGHLPEESLVVQPAHRGTAAALLLPALEVLRRDPDATLLVLPAEEWVEDEARFAASLQRAIVEVEAEPDRAVLLGTKPDAAHGGRGWIVTGRASAPGAAADVVALLQAPPARAELDGRAGGGLWSTSILAARVRTLFELMGRTQPRLTNELLRATAPLATHAGTRPSDAVRGAYESLPRADLAQEVLAQATSALRCLALSPCGWTDFAAPEQASRSTVRDRSSVPSAARNAPS